MWLCRFHCTQKANASHVALDFVSEIEFHHCHKPAYLKKKNLGNSQSHISAPQCSSCDFYSFHVILIFAFVYVSFKRRLLKVDRKWIRLVHVCCQCQSTVHSHSGHGCRIIAPQPGHPAVPVSKVSGIQSNPLNSSQ